MTLSVLRWAGTQPCPGGEGTCGVGRGRDPPVLRAPRVRKQVGEVSEATYASRINIAVRPPEDYDAAQNGPSNRWAGGLLCVLPTCLHQTIVCDRV